MRPKPGRLCIVNPTMKRRASQPPMIPLIPHGWNSKPYVPVAFIRSTGVGMDDVGRKIISQLMVDGRSTFETLGKAIGYTGMGAKKRVDKLIGSGAIKVSAQLNLEHFDLCAALVLIETDGPETVQRLLRRFKFCPRVIRIFTTIGGYNVIALVAAENQKTLESISMEKCSIRNDEGIRRSEFYPIGGTYYSPFLPLRENLASKGLTSPPCNVECRTCEKYKSEECVGCPATENYRGPL